MAVIKARDDDVIDKHIVRVVQDQINAEKQLRCLKIFDAYNESGTKIVKKTLTKAKTNPMNQVLLEERDSYLRSRALSDKYTKSFDRMDEDGSVDAKTISILLSHIQKYSHQATRHLENIGKNVLAQTHELSKGSAAMQHMLTEIASARQRQQQHSDKMDVAWAAVEKKTGLSMAELLNEMEEE